jgi:hypothetical protein
MHDCTPYGHLAINNQALTDREAASACKVPLKVYQNRMAELLSRGVARRNDAGIIYSARMVKDEAAREYQASFGRLSLNNPNVPRPKHNAPRRDIPQGIPTGIPDKPSSAFAVASINKSDVIRSNASGVPLPWHVTQQGIVAKAQALGIIAEHDETPEHLRDRVRERLKNLQG